MKLSTSYAFVLAGALVALLPSPSAHAFEGSSAPAGIHQGFESSLTTTPKTAPRMVYDEATMTLVAVNELPVQTAAADTASVTAPAAGPTPIAIPTDTNGAATLLPMLIGAAESGNYPLAVAIGLMVVIFVIRQFFLKDLPTKYVQWATLAISIVGSMVTAYATGGSLPQALLAGIGVALTAIGSLHVLDEHAPTAASPTSTAAGVKLAAS